MNTALLKSKLQEALTLANLIEIFSENLEELTSELTRNYKEKELQKLKKDYDYYSEKLSKAKSDQVALVKYLQEIVLQPTISIDAKNNARVIGDIIVTPKN